MSRNARDIRMERASDFIVFLAREGYVEPLLNEHVRGKSGISCAGCGKIWPCNWRVLAEKALELLTKGLV